jgi:hypothetical protein
MLNSVCKNFAEGRYDQSSVEKFFELVKTQRYPSLFSDLAESFGMMMNKLEERESRLEEVIEALGKVKSKTE